MYYNKYFYFYIRINYFFSKPNFLPMFYSIPFFTDN